MTYDPSKDFYRDPSLPGRTAFIVAPTDTTDLPVYPKSLYVGTGGDVAVVPVGAADDTPIPFKNVPDGGYILLAVRRVMRTGTSAADILGLAG